MPNTHWNSMQQWIVAQMFDVYKKEKWLRNPKDILFESCTSENKAIVVDLWTLYFFVKVQAPEVMSHFKTIYITHDTVSMALQEINQVNDDDIRRVLIHLQREGKLRVLVIHSGGDSKRVPQYSALGKLFSPVPHQLPDGRSSTLFDEFMICMSSVPSRIREGMVLLSGDVLLLFNPLQIDYNNVGAAAISFKERVEVGKNHGVYVNGEDGNVRCCLQKKPEEELRKAGAVNEAGCVDIDTGALIFSTAMMDSLYSLIGTEEGYDRYVNGTVRLSLYADFLYPLAEDSTLEQFYLEKPEGEFCEELTEAREQVWKVLRPYRMKLLRLAPAKFIHFGTTKEILALMCGGVEEYAGLGWSSRVASSISGSTAGYNSVLSSRASIGKDCYLEVSYVHSRAKVGNNCVLSFVDLHDEVVPDGVVLHGLKQRDGKFVVRIFGVQDNPKENRLFGRDLDEVAEKLGTDLWDGGNHTLWTAELYPEKDTVREAAAAALNLYALVTGEGRPEDWKESPRKSLCSGFNAADPDAIIAWDRRMADLVMMDELAKAIRGQVPAQTLPKRRALTKIQRHWLEKRLARADFSEKLRLHYYLGVVLEDENEVQKCFGTIQSEVLEATVRSLSYNETAHIVKDTFHMHVFLPADGKCFHGRSPQTHFCLCLMDGYGILGSDPMKYL